MNQRKKLKEQYRQRKVVGGVYRIRNTANGRYLLMADDDLRGAENRHNFAVSTGGSPQLHPDFQADWKSCGPSAFVFEPVEELEKKEEQTLGEFQQDLAVLLELCLEREPHPELSYGK